MASFQGKVIAITGGASGIGFATARLLSSRGAAIAIADVQEEALHAAAATISNAGGRVKATVVDVRKPKELDDWLDGVIAEFGSLDGAANMAGVQRPSGQAEIKDHSDEQWEIVMGINCTGVFNCLRAELSKMTSGAAIVNISSVAGLIGFPHNAAYVASKHAVIGLTKTAAKESGKRNIRVNAICPGFIDTPMLQAAEDFTGRPMQTEQVALSRKAMPEEVAKLIAFLLSEESSYTSGAAYTVDGGWVC